MNNENSQIEHFDHLSLNSINITDELLSQLRNIVPQIFSENRIDFTKLQTILGDSIETNPERYGLAWAGKRDAFRNVQVPSIATLRPQLEESVDWDITENLIIEGDNLEVLKLLQKPYHSKVKMIYIDPPYNTSNEFIYPDNFREGLDDYLRYTQQLSKEGTATSSNKETNGRYHSNWLNMMYPRLFLARNLLCDDGIIFVSIDDHEVHNLRLLMDEVFGDENFVAQITWKSRKYPDSRAKTGISTDHEYILIYGKASVRLRGIERDESKFTNPDADPRGPWMSRSLLGLATKEQRPNLHYAIIDQTSGNIFEPPADTGWRYSKERMEQLISTNSILFPSKKDGRPREKKFRSDMQSELIAFPSIIDDTFTADGTVDIREIFGSDIFDFSKPSKLIQKLIAQGTDKDGIVLDFFAGSGTTAQAVMEQNQDGGNRKFILVQLPEKTDNPKYPTIANITRDRVRHVIGKFKKNKENKFIQENNSKKDFGFRSFKLDSSNFKIWSSYKPLQSAEQIAEQLNLYTNNIIPNRSELDRLYELILKSGRMLSAKIESIVIGKRTAFSVENGDLLICLEQHLDQETVRALFARKPQMLLCLDTAFDGNDALKTNIVLEAKSHSILFRTV